MQYEDVLFFLPDGGARFWILNRLALIRSGRFRIPPSQLTIQNLVVLPLWFAYPNIASQINLQILQQALPIKHQLAQTLKNQTATAHNIKLPTKNCCKTTCISKAKQEANVHIPKCHHACMSKAEADTFVTLDVDAAPKSTS